MNIHDEEGVSLEEMNALQAETNLISDLCVFWSDVAECDREQAERFIGKPVEQ